MEEKEVISNIAVVGVYFWKSANILFKSIEKIIKDKISKNGIYYLSLSFNSLIDENYYVSYYNVNNIKILDTESDIKFLV